ncbi:MAG TPA: RraA family protein [Chthoniobacteraceae bacterium]|nr:RraA family protein [Chthoniobacteraceae bacterium]
MNLPNTSPVSTLTPATGALPPAANFSDAMRSLGLGTGAMAASMRPVFTPVRLYGPAYTVRCYAGATWALEEALELAPEGSVLVVDGGGFSKAVLMGGLMSLRAAQRGLAGAVIDGAVRDLPELRAAQWPVFSSSLTPAGGSSDPQGAWEVTVSCGGVSVSPGDHVVADDDGVVVVPAREWERVKETAYAIELKERFLEARLREGRPLGEAVRLWKEQV